MDSNDKSVKGVSRWAGPWQAGWSGMTRPSQSHMERELSSLGHRSKRAQSQALPKNSQRRIQQIGFAATGLAATVWLVAVVWVWQIIT